MDTIEKTITSSVYTKSDIRTLISCLEKLKYGKYSKESDLEQEVSKICPTSTFKIVKDLVNKPSIRNNNSGEALTNIIKVLEKIPCLTLEIAFEPTTSFVQKIAMELRSICKESLVVDWKVNKEILLGATLSHNGHYKDMSIRLYQILKDSTDK